MEEVRCPSLDPNDPDRVLLTQYGPAPPDNGDLSVWNDDDYEDKSKDGKNKKKKQKKKEEGDERGDVVPIPIKFELTPLVNLFTEENLVSDN